MKIFSILESRRDQILTLAISLFLSLGLLQQVINIGNTVPFHDWDEAIYAQVAKELYQNPKILLTYNGSPWFEKPPLPSALFALSKNLPIKSEISMRMVSLLFSLLSLFAVFKILKKLAVKTPYIIIALLICAYPPMFRDRSVLVNVDIMLASSWLIFILGQLYEKKSIRLLGLLVGVLSKSLLGFIPFFADIGIHILTAKISRQKVVEWTVFFLSASLWHIYMAFFYGNSFIQSHFVDHLVSRIVRPIELHFGDKWYYLIRIWEQTGIFMILASVSGAFIIFSFLIAYYKKSKSTQELSKTLPIAIVPALYFILLTISKSKLHWYIAPLIPFVAMLTAIGFAKLQNINLPKWATLINKSAQIAIASYCVFVFAKSVDYIQADWYTPTDKTIIGLCVGKSVTQNDKITYLVPAQERKDAHVIEAAHLQIGSSFIYGSAPAFLYYANSPVDFVYKENLLSKSLGNSTILVVEKSDLTAQSIAEDVGIWTNDSKPFCQTKTLFAFRKSEY